MPTAAELRASERRRELLVRRLRILAGVIAFAITVFVAWLVPQLPIFHIRQVEVVGASAVSDLTVRNRIEDLVAGQTIWTIDAGAIEKRLEELPFVHRVSVDRHMPGGISITVSEYSPLALGMADNGTWLVARDGRVLVKGRLDDWLGRVPVVRLEDGTVRAGQRVGDEPALQLLRSVPQTFPGMFRSVEITNEGVVAEIADGPEIRFGQPDEFERKLLVAERLMTLYGPRRRASIEYIDVTVPARPALKISTGAPA